MPPDILLTTARADQYQNCWLIVFAVFSNNINELAQSFIQGNLELNVKNDINHLTPEIPQHGVPRPGAPRHNIIFLTVFAKF